MTLCPKILISTLAATLLSCGLSPNKSASRDNANPSEDIVEENRDAKVQLENGVRVTAPPGALEVGVTLKISDPSDSKKISAAISNTGIKLDDIAFEIDAESLEKQKITTANQALLVEIPIAKTELTLAEDHNYCVLAYIKADDAVYIWRNHLLILKDRKLTFTTTKLGAYQLATCNDNNRISTLSEVTKTENGSDSPGVLGYWESPCWPVVDPDDSDAPPMNIKVMRETYAFRGDNTYEQEILIYKDHHPDETVNPNYDCEGDPQSRFTYTGTYLEGKKFNDFDTQMNLVVKTYSLTPLLEEYADLLNEYLGETCSWELDTPTDLLANNCFNEDNPPPKEGWTVFTSFYKDDVKIYFGQKTQTLNGTSDETRLIAKEATPLIHAGTEETLDWGYSSN